MYAYIQQISIKSVLTSFVPVYPKNRPKKPVKIELKSGKKIIQKSKYGTNSNMSIFVLFEQVRYLTGKLRNIKIFKQHQRNASIKLHIQNLHDDFLKNGNSNVLKDKQLKKWYLLLHEFREILLTYKKLIHKHHH